MEHRILYVLNWQLQSVTPVCFLDFFISFFDIGDAEEIAAFKLRSIEYNLLHMHYDATYTEFKPSIIAATALIAERAQNAPPENLSEPFLYCQFIDTDELENCLNILMEQARANNVRIYHLPPLPLPPHLADNEAGANQQEEEEEQRRRRWRIGGGVGRATA
ncbi:putative cyclin-D6-1 [Camellia lanceoleosa]|nr:putative cyclin-D6-1 [Camellia lanceoleosa]